MSAIAEVYKTEGNEAYLKEDYSNAIYFYTEGIKVNCKDLDLKAKLYSNRAYANLRFGESITKITESKETKSIHRLDVSGSTGPGGSCPPPCPLASYGSGLYT